MVIIGRKWFMLDGGSIRRYWLVLVGGAGSKERAVLVARLSENVLFVRLKGC